MCKLCKRMICPASCPSAKRKSASFPAVRLQRCVLCGEEPEAGAQFYDAHGFPYCEACLMQLEAGALIRICEIGGAEALQLLGFTTDLPQGG